MLRSNLQGYTHRGREKHDAPVTMMGEKKARPGGCCAHFLSNVIFLCPPSGLIEISTVERGVVSLYGVKSELFVAMNSRGRLYGTVGMHRISFIVPQYGESGAACIFLLFACLALVLFRPAASDYML